MMKLAMSSVTAVISYFLCIFLRYFDDEIQNTLLVMQGIVPYPLRLVLADEVLNLAPTTSEEVSVCVSPLAICLFFKTISLASSKRSNALVSDKKR